MYNHCDSLLTLYTVQGIVLGDVLRRLGLLSSSATSRMP